MKGDKIVRLFINFDGQLQDHDILVHIRRQPVQHLSTSLDAPRASRSQTRTQRPQEIETLPRALSPPTRSEANREVRPTASTSVSSGASTRTSGPRIVPESVVSLKRQGDQQEPVIPPLKLRRHTPSNYSDSDFGPLEPAEKVRDWWFHCPPSDRRLRSAGPVEEVELPRRPLEWKQQ